MPKEKKERVKRTRAKAKNVIQKVVVNVGGRGGGGRKSTAPSGPPRPTPLQQATQFLQATQSRPPVLGESMIQSSQMLQRLLDPINMRLEVLMRQRQAEGQPINIPAINMPPINISNPINIRQPDIFMAPPNVSINQRFPDINIQPFPNMDQHRDHDRQHVADLPDAPLVRPNAPLVLAGPMRMDDPHEDVPLNQVDPVLIGKGSVEPLPQGNQGKQEAAQPIKTKGPRIAPKKPIEEPAQPASVQSTREDLLETLRIIEQSQGVKGNQKSRKGFMTKRELIDIVANITGRPFSPSTSADYDRIKRKAITVIRDIVAKL